MSEQNEIMQYFQVWKNGKLATTNWFLTLEDAQNWADKDTIQFIHWD